MTEVVLRLWGTFCSYVRKGRETVPHDKGIEIPEGITSGRVTTEWIEIDPTNPVEMRDGGEPRAPYSQSADPKKTGKSGR